MVLTSITALASGFEGCEKKLEIDFQLASNEQNLRDIPRAELDDILSEAKCTIISVQHNRDFDAYVLSESSLFIYPAKILLKTCGTTLLLACTRSLLAAAAKVGATPDFLQFSRSNFLFPDKQHYPHRHFSEETDYLDKELNIKGEAFILGKVNGARWHLYIWDFNRVEAAEYRQQTLEVIMFNLNPDVMRVFYKAGEGESSGVVDTMTHETQEEKTSTTATTTSSDLSIESNDSPKATTPSSTSSEATIKSGIDKLFDNTLIDSHLFTPCGYSCNGMINPDSPDDQLVANSPRSHSNRFHGKQGKNEQAYFTIHITPEPECSFVSFETNLVLPNYTGLVQRVVDTFQPGNFCVSLFVDGKSDISDSISGLSWNDMKGYVHKGVTHHSFEAGYNATVSQYRSVAQAESNASSP